MLTERLLTKAVRSFQAVPAEQARNDGGVLYFKWLSPCPDVEAFWVSVKSSEITLSCKISHTHFSPTRYLRERLTNLQLKRRIVRDSVAETSRFLVGKIAVSISYDKEGKPHSYGWYAQDQLPAFISHSRNVFGADISTRAWTWFGEVKL